VSLSDVLVPLDDDLELPERVWAPRQEGLTNPQIARRLMISVPDVYEALDKVLPVLDHRYRKQAVSEALLNIDVIIGYHMSKVSDPESACRRRPKVRTAYPPTSARAARQELQGGTDRRHKPRQAR
jgi:hypothetical protein